MFEEIWFTYDLNPSPAFLVDFIFFFKQNVHSD